MVNVLITTVIDQVPNGVAIATSIAAFDTKEDAEKAIKILKHFSPGRGIWRQAEIL